MGRAPGAKSSAPRPRRSSRETPLPETLEVEIVGIDSDGDARARPVRWEGRPPLILMTPEPNGRPGLAVGERVLAQLKPLGYGRYQGRTLKRLSETPGRVVGIFRAGATGGRIMPCDRHSKAEWRVRKGETNGAETDEIVVAVPLPGSGAMQRSARIIERLGRLDDARSVSLICLHIHDIPQIFPPEVLAEAALGGPVALGTREDLRAVELVTIDGEDARDFDDAVFAEPTSSGFRLIVAIADVAHYVAAGSALDREAQRRGNSVYFPDRVVPMLPETLSNGWCSLQPGEDRGCLFVDMQIGPDGRKHSHRFGRGVMRSVARLTYEQIQLQFDSGDAGDFGRERIAALYGAFHALLTARRARGTLDLDLPDRRVLLDEQGKVTQIVPRTRLDSHRLIEEFMVAANVAAAEELERLRQTCVWRVHAPPSEEKLDRLRTFLHGFDITLPPAARVHTRDLDHVLALVEGTAHAAMVNDVMLRSQSQAEYRTDNIGHFGLALPQYAHFTSPIRRYADLMVHRALLAGLNTQADGLPPAVVAQWSDIAAHVTATERRAARAERDAIDRYLSAYLQERIGQSFDARISGVARFGVFVTEPLSGATGIIPVVSIGGDYWIHDEATQTLSGRQSGRIFRLAQDVRVRLIEANPITGGLVFHLVDGMKRRNST
jgi:ribonuclease R